MSDSSPITGLLRHLASRPGHDEVKADFRDLLVKEFGVELGALDFERRVPEVRGRLDALIGRTVFEAKRDLDKEWDDVERRMPDYLADREHEEKEHFVGIASDGLKWVVFEREAGKLVVVKRTTLDPEKSGQFLAWLDGALALKSSLSPDALTIHAELGQDSVAYRRVDTRLRQLWANLASDPAVMLKRQLWAELLKLVYGREVQSDELWFQHTFLVIVAKCIALAVMRMHEDDPKRLLSGEAFADAGINGAVESDFFDWVVADPDGEELVRRIMNHVRRFRLAEVESDVLKILYESLVDREERHGLGEYYTPDWLAAKMVRRAIERPLEQRVLDPACGSGTFLFHAVRNFLAAAQDAGLDANRRAAEVCEHVAGIDIHPVAIIIARVTFLLALAPALAARKGSLSIPVYLGDSLQLSISQFLAGKELSIGVPPPAAGKGRSGEKNGNGREQLDFPETFCRDPILFDKAIERMRSGSFDSVCVAWDEAWTMDDSVQPLFPVPSCAVFGRRQARSAPMPDKVRAYSGVLAYRDAPESVADADLKVTEGAPALEVAQNRGGSVYRNVFRQGAIIVPRMMWFVERKASGRLGSDPSAPLVISRRSTQEKKPWRDADAIENKVEAEFLKPALLGESVAPYRVLRTYEAVIPATENGTILDAESAANRGFGDLHGWLTKAQRIWDRYNESDRTLTGQLNYINQLSSQFPIAALRVVYAASGTIPAACILRDDRSVIEHKLYWMKLASGGGGRVLLGRHPQ